MELSEFQKDILKQQIELVDKAIASIDEIQLRLKNWCIVVRGGGLYLISKDLGNPAVLILLTAIVPVLFSMADMIWARQMLIVNFREERIAIFVNGKMDDAHFSLSDPVAKRYVRDPAFKRAQLLSRQ